MAKTPTAAISTDSGEATPPPLPDALITPTTSGITKAEEKTGPMKPTDWAITSGRVRTFAPRRSYACRSCLAMAASLVGQIVRTQTIYCQYSPSAAALAASERQNAPMAAVSSMNCDGLTQMVVKPPAKIGKASCRERV